MSQPVLSKFLTVVFYCLAAVCSNGNINAQDSLSLDEAIRLGLENNYGIIIARNDAAIADMNNHLGAAGFLPQINAGGNKSWTVSNTHIELPSKDIIIIREGSDAHSDNFNPNVQLTWTLFDGCNMFVSKSRLGELARIGELDLRIAIENTVTDIINSYNQIHQQQKAIAVINEALDLSRLRKN